MTSSTMQEWMLKYPAAAAELMTLITQPLALKDERILGKSEACSQQRVRFEVAKQGAFSFRNNNGATPYKCKECGAKQRPVRYGLANESQTMNRKVKSSDLICIIPRKITPEMVGLTIGQFGSIENKKKDWTFKGDDHESAQAAWLTLVKSLGGYARFSTGSVDLSELF